VSGEREARLWFAQALADLDTAKDNARSHPDAACFMAEQAAERALKALELAATGSVTHTHSLDVLLGRLLELNALSTSLHRRAVRELQQKNKEARYPDMLIDTYPAAYFTPEDAAEAVHQAEEILDAVRADLPFVP
jgi:HEPN domain-containing protein